MFFDACYLMMQKLYSISDRRMVEYEAMVELHHQVNQSTFKKTLSHCHFVHQKSDRECLGLQLGLNTEGLATNCPQHKPWHGPTYF